MRYSFLTIGTLVLFSSCVHYTTLYTGTNGGQKIAIQRYYSPCCGWCGQRIILDNLKGEQQSLLINCELENRDSRQCTYYGIGTQKHVDTYKGKFIDHRSAYKPVYDTIELKKLYPEIDREAYFDTLFLSKPLIRLTSSDSILIAEALAYKKDTSCKSNYIKLIQGMFW